MHLEVLVLKVKSRIRAKSNAANEEIRDLICAAEADMKKEGIVGTADDPLYLQALVLYCKANYGYDKDTERFSDAYNSLKISMALCGDYEEGAQDGD